VTSDQAAVAKAYAGISTNSQAAFMPPVATSLPFAEGRTVYNLINRNMKEFQSFVADVVAGAHAIQSASTAMAVAYMTTDGDAASSLNAVDFAFADGGKAPDGFPTGKGVSTLSDQASANADTSGRNTEAGIAAQQLAAGPDSDMLRYAKSQVVAGGITIYTFADGSMLQVSSAASTNPYISSSSTTYSVYRQGDNKPATTTTKGTSYDYSGQKTESTSTTTTNSDGKQVSSTESTTHLSGGGVQVTSTTTGADGKPVTITAKADPPDPKPAGADGGEIDRLEQKYDSQGNTQYQNA
jgi:hypothetical protein